MLKLSGKNVLVVGTKRSGLGAIALLQKQGACVRAMDQAIPTEDIGVPVVLQSPDNLGHPDLIVLSPAVPFDAPLFVEARQRGIEVIGEVELASYFLEGPIIGITGSNGKTTTTALTGHLLKECGIPVQVGGNIGTAVTSMVSSSRADQWNVLELSSFQLESIQHFRADIAAVLNITPDHLDRHKTLHNYAAVKRRLLETQTASGHAILNANDPVCREMAKHTKAHLHWFTSDLMINCKPLMHRSDVPLRGTHNLENVTAAALMAHVAGAPLDKIAQAVTTFPGVEHRIEYVRTLNGVSYFNDSKATNVDATLKAVDSFEGKLWIILGGKDKGGSYEPLVEPLQTKGKAALLIGAAAPLIRETFEGRIPYIECGTLNAAVEYAYGHAQPGDTVLLAPACASFDQFENYEHRGRMFKHLVAELS